MARRSNQVRNILAPSYSGPSHRGGLSMRRRLAPRRALDLGPWQRRLFYVTAHARRERAGTLDPTALRALTTARRWRTA